MIVVHHLNNSRSQRILWLLEELGVPYDIRRYQRDRQTMLAPPELKAVHPLGKSPVVEVDGQVLVESGAIVEHFADRYAGGRLARAHDSPARFQYIYWLHYAEGSAVTPMLFELYLRLLGGGTDQLSGTVNAQIVQQLTYIEGALKQRSYFVGARFTAADIQMTFVLEFAQASGRLSGYPRLQDYLRRMHDRAAYRRSIDKGGEYSLGQFGKRA